mmetsp:Transcript_8169/g.15629  ORF Transcript_8169/g.15629 Transcript_8169/m.15629 type:complete len:90 (+) Transcript_8169:952-1221(+)
MNYTPAAIHFVVTAIRAEVNVRDTGGGSVVAIAPDWAATMRQWFDSSFRKALSGHTSGDDDNAWKSTLLNEFLNSRGKNGVHSSKKDHA